MTGPGRPGPVSLRDDGRLRGRQVNLLVAIDRKLTRVLEWLLVTLLAVFLVVVCLLVILRYGLSESIFGGNEFITIAFLYTSAIGGAVGITRHEHIAITFFIDKLPHALKMAVYILGLVLIAVVNGYMIHYSVGWMQQAGHFPWQPFDMPQGYVHAAIPIGCSLAILFCAIKIVLALGGREKIDLLWMPED